jgi:hypothetical protein
LDVPPQATKPVTIRAQEKAEARRIPTVHQTKL